MGKKSSPRQVELSLGTPLGGRGCKGTLIHKSEFAFQTFFGVYSTDVHGGRPSFVAAAVFQKARKFLKRPLKKGVDPGSGTNKAQIVGTYWLLKCSTGPDKDPESFFCLFFVFFWKLLKMASRLRIREQSSLVRYEE